jgi:hypothetical protein
MELEILLPASQDPASGTYPELDEYNPHSHTIIFKIHFNIILLPMHRSSK